MEIYKIHKIAAFSIGNKGGNPAGVVLTEKMMKEKEMLALAKKTGYSETAFLHFENEGWHIRYFSPEIEVDFCGHATIATGAVLGNQFGEGVYKLFSNKGLISLTVNRSTENDFTISFQSPKTWSKPAPPTVINEVLDLFNLTNLDLNTDFPVRYAFAGAKHLILMVKNREILANMNYEYEKTKTLMLREGLITISLLWIKSKDIFHSRNAFASGGVYEDPATGAAAAALAGYLRDINWNGSNIFKIIQGEDMGVPSQLIVEFTEVLGSSVKISGSARKIEF